MGEVKAAAEAEDNLICHNQPKSNFQYIKKTGHTEAYCQTNQKDKQKHTDFFEKVEDESKLFMDNSQNTNNSDGVWIINSRCLNHIASTKSLFRDLDE